MERQKSSSGLAGSYCSYAALGVFSSSAWVHASIVILPSKSQSMQRCSLTS